MIRPSIALALLTALIPLALPASAQLPIFQDNMEIGDTSRWSATEPYVPNCDCYFSGDCFAGTRCSYGPGGPSTEDICLWREPKPNGNPGTGCDVNREGAWGPICDGLCVPIRAGSPVGREKADLAVRAARLWADALLLPAIRGGGPVDARLAEEALALPFADPQAPWLLGREVASLLAVASHRGFYDHFCHFEHDHPYETYVDLSGDPCRAEAGRLTAGALAAELQKPGSGAAALARVPLFCPTWQSLFAPQCAPGPGALDCFHGRVRDAAVFLTTPAAGLEPAPF